VCALPDYLPEFFPLPPSEWRNRRAEEQPWFRGGASSRGLRESVDAASDYNPRPVMKLLASTASPYARKVRVVLAEKKIECELQPVDVSPVDNPVKRPQSARQDPTLVLDDGTALYDSA